MHFRCNYDLGCYHNKGRKKAEALKKYVKEKKTLQAGIYNTGEGT